MKNVHMHKKRKLDLESKSEMIICKVFRKKSFCINTYLNEI